MTVRPAPNETSVVTDYSSVLELPYPAANGTTNTVVAVTPNVVVNALNAVSIIWGANTTEVAGTSSVTVPEGTGATFVFLDSLNSWLVTSCSSASAFAIGNNFDTAGQMLVGSGTYSATILNPGTDGQYLVADSTQPAGLNWHTPISFRAHMSSGLTTSVVNTFTAAKFNTVDWDTNSAYSTGTGAYTAPVAGKYLVQGTLTSNTFPSSPNRSIAMIYKGSTEVSRGTDLITSYTGPITSTVNDLVSCAAGDTLTIYYFINNTVGFQTGAQYNYFSVLQVA